MVLKELLDIWNTREKALVDAGPGGTTLGGVLHTRPLGAALMSKHLVCAARRISSRLPRYWKPGSGAGQQVTLLSNRSLAAELAPAHQQTSAGFRAYRAAYTVVTVGLLIMHRNMLKMPWHGAALLPEPQNAVLGQVKQGTPDYDRIAAEAARTVRPHAVPFMLSTVAYAAYRLQSVRAFLAVPYSCVRTVVLEDCIHCHCFPPMQCCFACIRLAETRVAMPAQIPGRENGGNCDIKNLSKGCKVYFPVFVEGANLSMGDMHFSQVGIALMSTIILRLFCNRALPSPHSPSCWHARTFFKATDISMLHLRM